MPCFHPVDCWQSKKKLPTSGKSQILFRYPGSRRVSYYEALKVPCGMCIGCALDRSRSWAVRCVHESQMHDDSSFITLTYDPKFLPQYGSLVKEHFTLFMKRLRKAIEPIKIKFFMCGEYGDKGERPHYHALIFGYGFPNRKFFQEKNGTKLFVDESLEKLWPYGFSTCGDITVASAAYVARYCLKKVQAREDGVEMDADNFSGQISEYVNMSRGGRAGKGLAYNWYCDFKSDVFPCDNVIVKGKMFKTPRYYDKQLELDDVELLTKIKGERKAKALECADDNTPERLLVKEACKKAQIKQLKRGYENDST